MSNPGGARTKASVFSANNQAIGKACNRTFAQRAVHFGLSPVQVNC